MNHTVLIYSIAAIIFAGLAAFTVSPAVRVFAFKIGAVDVPRDDRRMHDHPIPRMGGLGIFIAFILATAVFCDYTPTLFTMWAGGFIIVCTGIIDDVHPLHPLIKLLAQVVVALLAVWQGMTIEFIQIFGKYYTFGIFSIPITILWIVGLTNAINLIDGLDGLSCGVSAICSTALMTIMLLKGDSASAVITAALVGSCLGFLPFNSNPAKTFMGDTGALFLGYTLSLLSIQGLFKFHTIMSFLIPLSIFGLPLFDTTFAFLRRILRGKSPFSADRGHIHHRLIDMGFNQKQTVRILYAICGILGVSAVLLSFEFFGKAAIVIVAGFTIFLINYIIFHNKDARKYTGLDLSEDKTSANKVDLFGEDGDTWESTSENEETAGAPFSTDSVPDEASKNDLTIRGGTEFPHSERSRTVSQQTGAVKDKPNSKKQSPREQKNSGQDESDASDSDDSHRRETSSSLNSTTSRPARRTSPKPAEPRRAARPVKGEKPDQQFSASGQEFPGERISEPFFENNAKTAGTHTQKSQRMQTVRSAPKTTDFSSENFAASNHAKPYPKNVGADKQPYGQSSFLPKNKSSANDFFELKSASGTTGHRKRNFSAPSDFSDIFEAAEHEHKTNKYNGNQTVQSSRSGTLQTKKMRRAVRFAPLKESV
ncbi:MAG: MraY family glycosyltransferase [Firmicutes bacterium]|nr:MraY family glycosyltransferase [Bacillota bacterium]